MCLFSLRSVSACVCWLLFELLFSRYIWPTIERSCGEGALTVTEATDATRRCRAVKKKKKKPGPPQQQKAACSYMMRVLSQQTSAVFKVPLSSELNQTLSPQQDRERRKNTMHRSTHELQGIGSHLKFTFRGNGKEKHSQFSDRADLDHHLNQPFTLLLSVVETKLTSSPLPSLHLIISPINFVWNNLLPVYLFVCLSVHLSIYLSTY